MSTYTIPNVVARDARGERILDVYSHLLTERVIYVGTAIDAGVANALTAQLLHLDATANRSEEHTSELQSRENLVCRLLLEKKKKKKEAVNDTRRQVGSTEQ